VKLIIIISSGLHHIASYNSCCFLTYLLRSLEIWWNKETWICTKNTLMKSVFSQSSSLTASGTLTALPPTVTVAWATSGNCVEEWFPQIITLCTSWDETPTRVPIYHSNSKRLNKTLLCITDNNTSSIIADSHSSAPPLPSPGFRILLISHNSWDFLFPLFLRLISSIYR